MLRMLSLLFVLLSVVAAFAQTNDVETNASALQLVIAEHVKDIKKGSVKTAPPIIAKVSALGGDAAANFLSLWQEKSLWYRKADDLIFSAYKSDDGSFQLFDIETSQLVSTASKSEIKQIKPNSGLRALIGQSLVTIRLASEEVETRRNALVSLSRKGKAQYLVPLRAAINEETDAPLKAEMQRLERFLTMNFDASSDARIKAINEFANDLSVEARANLNRLVTTKIILATSAKKGANIRQAIVPGESALSIADAYQLLVDDGEVQPIPTASERKQTLIKNIDDGKVDGFTIHKLHTQKNRDAAYLSLVADGVAPFWSPGLDETIVVEQYEFIEVYDENDPAVTAAIEETLASIETKVAISEFADVALDGLSLASIYFLAAIGLAITFGVMGVINMAHGEFIMMGAYTGYVVQQFITNYTVSIVVAVPLAFGVTFAAGVLMERLVIRHLYNRPLETLLATFGISVALQQLAKNIFGTQARPLTAPDWLDGALVINDVISISWIRIAIFALSILFFILLMFILNKTRFGVETRAVTQNRRMAASMGINPNLVNMLTFGLGSGIAGIAGVAIGLYAKVTSEMGGDYIVQSFMTVVVGGVGNIWGTLAGAVMIGFLQKGIEWFNPTNTLAAQTFMIVFIIIFIQFRPRGIVALKGRAAGD